MSIKLIIDERFMLSIQRNGFTFNTLILCVTLANLSQYTFLNECVYDTHITYILFKRWKKDDDDKRR